MTQTNCNLCGGGDFQTLHHRTWRGLDLNTVLCCGCGLVFHQPLLEDSDREEAGATCAELHVSRTLGSRQILRAMRRADRQLRVLRPYIDSRRNVLVIGSGFGMLDRDLQRAGMCVTALEPDSSLARLLLFPPTGMIEVAKDWPAIEVIQSTFESADLGDRKFDLVVCSHVIEHVVEPSWFLTKIRRHLGEDGVLFLETPSVTRPKVGPYRVFSEAHNYHFAPQTMRWMLQKCGFAVRLLREFRHEAMQVIAVATLPSAPDIDSAYAQEVLRAIEDHRRWYHAKLMFITRKIPILRDWWAHRYVDHVS